MPTDKEKSEAAIDAAYREKMTEPVGLSAVPPPAPLDPAESAALDELEAEARARGDEEELAYIAHLRTHPGEFRRELEGAADDDAE